MATTEEPQWFDGAEPSRAQSTVTVLDQQGDKLVRVGSVTGLGHGERIYAVRFLGDKGYVVTFRQVDPLYTLDLSDPTAPKVAGELKIPGYSAYLHPVGDEPAARRRPRGRQRPGLAVRRLQPGRAAAARACSLRPRARRRSRSEPHAFLYWAPANLAVMPLHDATARTARGSAGAAGIRIGANTLTHAGARRSTRAPSAGEVPIERSFVIGDRALHAVVPRDRLERARGSRALSYTALSKEEGRRGARRRGIPGTAAMRVCCSAAGEGLAAERWP